MNSTSVRYLCVKLISVNFSPVKGLQIKLSKVKKDFSTKFLEFKLTMSVNKELAQVKLS